MVEIDEVLKVWRRERIKEIEGPPVDNTEKLDDEKIFNEIAKNSQSHDLMYQPGIPHNHPSRKNISFWKESVMKPSHNLILTNSRLKDTDTLLNFYYVFAIAQIIFILILMNLAKA